jgi:hypothetical protein
MPVVVAALVAGYVLSRAAAAQERPGNWLLPAGAAAAFVLWTLIAIVHEGATGFWIEHTRNLWANQIWFDLLFAAALALTFMLPRARALGMRTLPWTVLVLATGSIGLLAMAARILFLEAARRGGVGSDPARKA